MLANTPFFDLMNRRDGVDFSKFINASTPNENYIEFRGFVIPVDYGDPEREYRALRHGCAMFDLMPNIKYRLSGEGSGPLLDRLLTRPVRKARPQLCLYGLMCNEDGYLRNDAIIYKFSDDDYLFMPALPEQAELEEVARRHGIPEVSIADCSDQLAGVALQGPLSAAVLTQWGFEGVGDMKPFNFREFEFAGERILIARMGFTGDLGYECWFDPRLCDAVAAGLRSASQELGVELLGYGLAVVEACRIESGHIVPGRDFAIPGISKPGFERFPSELNLDRLVKFDDRPFTGREALLDAQLRGPRFELRSFTTPRAVLPRGADLFATVDGAEVAIGRIASTSWSWGLERTIGHASLSRPYADRRAAYVYVGDETVELTLSTGPLLDLERRAQVPAPLQGLSATPPARPFFDAMRTKFSGVSRSPTPTD